MDESMKQFQQGLIEVEIEAENLLLARHEVIATNIGCFTADAVIQNIVIIKYLWLQLVEIDRVRNGNREALTALRKRAKTTNTSVPSPFESIMRDVDTRPLVKEVCATCGDHDSREKTLLMFPGTDVFAAIPFHAAHTILEKGNASPFPECDFYMITF